MQLGLLNYILLVSRPIGLYQWLLLIDLYVLSSEIIGLENNSNANFKTVGLRFVAHHHRLD